MILSEIGQTAEKFWREIPDHFPNIKLDEFIIMPDHIHGIIIIKTPKLGVSTAKLGVSMNPPVQAPNLGVSIEYFENIKNIKSLNPFWKSNSIGSIINQFKRICTITIKNNGIDFAWQSRFHDHIIRTNTELNRIRKYIRENPEKFICNS